MITRETVNYVFLCKPANSCVGMHQDLKLENPRILSVCTGRICILSADFLSVQSRLIGTISGDQFAYSYYIFNASQTLAGESETKIYLRSQQFLNGTVSSDLRWVLLCINRKLLSRAIGAHHKILILLKGHLTIYKRRSIVRTAWQF